MGRVRFRGRGRNRVMFIFLDNNVDPGSTKVLLAKSRCTSGGTYKDTFNYNTLIQ